MRLSSARVKFCQIPYANFEMTSRFLSKFCIPLQFHERLFLCTLLAQTIYTLLKRSPLKWKSLQLLSTQLKICQIPYANFETTSQLLSKFCNPSSFSWNITPLYFFSSNNLYFAQKESIKNENYWDFRALGSNFMKFLMPILKRLVDSSTNFESLFSFMKGHSSVLF